VSDIEVWHGLYGAADGRWLIVTGPIGDVGVPHVGDLMSLGSTCDVFTRLYNRLAELTRGYPKPAIQEQIAQIAGISQQNVARYIAGVNVPRPESIDWPALVRTLYSLGASDPFALDPLMED
jgi:hypothetical protein